jgi:hypothetical protein
MIRMSYLPLVMILMQAYAVRFRTSTNRYNSLSFALKFRIQVVTIRNYSQTVANIRHGIVLNRLICTLAEGDLITCEL